MRPRRSRVAGSQQLVGLIVQLARFGIVLALGAEARIFGSLGFREGRLAFLII